MSDLLNAFSFFSQNIHVAGWITIVTLAIKVTIKITNFVGKIDSTKQTVDLLATNHLPHLQTSLNEICKKMDDNTNEIKGLRQDLLTFALNKKD